MTTERGAAIVGTLSSNPPERNAARTGSSLPHLASVSTCAHKDCNKYLLESRPACSFLITYCIRI